MSEPRSKAVLSQAIIDSLAGTGANVTELLREVEGLKGILQGKKTVEQWLEEVDYSDNDDYTPSVFALEYINFMKMCNGVDGSDNLTPVVHYRVLDTFTLETDRIANLMFRGFGKTTLIQYLFPFIAVMRDFPGLGAIDFAIYVSDSIENGVASFKDSLEALWKRSAFLQQMLPEKIDGKVVTFFNATKWQMTNANGECLVVRGYGIKTGIRGVKSKGKRPQLAVIDDVISDDEAESDVLITKINNTIDKAITHALDTNKRKILWMGTPFNAKDPLYMAIESGAWAVNLFPVAEKFPCSREEFRGAWEDRFTFEFLLREYVVAAQAGKISSFNQELMLRIMGDADRLVDDVDIQWYNREDVLLNLVDFNIYITTDFAVSDKEHADLSAISVWAVNAHGEIYWIDGWIGQVTLDKTIDELFRLARKYRPNGVGVEASGQQKGFIAWIRKEMIRRNIHFAFARNLTNNRAGPTNNTNNQAGVYSVVNKITAFNMVLPRFKTKTMFFPRQMAKTSDALIELMAELKLISPSGIRSRYADMLDTVSMLGKIQIDLPEMYGYASAPINAEDSFYGRSVYEDESEQLYGYHDHDDSNYLERYV